MKKEKRQQISKEKQYADLIEVDDDLIEEVEYMYLAMDIAKQIEQGHVDVEKIAKVRLMSCNDRDHLKGDYCIHVAKYILKNAALTEELEGKISRNNEGKKMKVTEALAKSVYRNHFRKDLSIKSFCSIAGISKSKYYRILNQEVEDEKTKKLLKSAFKQVRYEEEIS